MLEVRSGLARRAAAGALALALVSLTPEQSLACSVCQAGDPLFSSGAATPVEPLGGSVYLELQGWRKTSGLLPHGDEAMALVHEDGHEDEHHHGEEREHDDEAGGREINQSQILSLYAAVSPLDRLTLTFHVPWKFSSIIEDPTNEPSTRSTLSGIGDASLTVGYVVWRDRDVMPSTWLELRAFGKVPTGQRAQQVDGNVDPHLQLGTGSWDWGVGVAAGRRESWGTLYASVLQRMNRAGALDYEYGDVTLANLALEAPVGHLVGAPALDALIPGLELNFRYAGHDQVDGRRYADSGGAILYLTPSLRVKIPGLGSGAPWLRFAAQLPLGQTWLHAQQHEGVVWSAGLGVRF